MKLHLPKNLRIAIHSCLAVASGIATTVGTGFVVGGSVAVAFVAAHAQAEINDLPANVTGDDAALDLTQLGSPDVIDSASAEFNDGTPLMLAGGVNLLPELYGNPPTAVIERVQADSCKYADFESISFVDINEGSQYGGAIYGDQNSTITLSENGSVTFDGNKVFYSRAVCGGAIYGGTNSTITLSANEIVTFSGNTASSSSMGVAASGGAIYGSTNSTIALIDNEIVTFCGNTAYGAAYGGAICVNSGSITLIANGSVTFSRNTSSSRGGAIDGNSSRITLSANGSVTFSGNTSAEGGGAIYAGWSGACTLTLNDNGSVTFSGNTASGSSSARGGAICGGVASTISLSDNGSVIFDRNTASASSGPASGGAIAGGSTLTLNDNGSVTFSGNTASSDSGHAARGGAIYGDSITLNDNGSVTFSGNTASSASAYIYGGSISSSGGAIYAGGNLNIRNNDSVLFEKNAEIHGDYYRLRSIYAMGDSISLSAGEGKSIEFRDSVYTAGDTYINSDYTDADGNTTSSQGAVIFSGKYTEQHLNAILTDNNVNRTATAEEILHSQTSEIRKNVYVNGGSLQIVDGAVLKVRGGTVSIAEGSNATLAVSDAELVAENAKIEVGASATLQLSNGASITADKISIKDGATLALGDIAVTTSASDSMVAAYRLSSLNVINADLTFAAGSTLVTDGTGIYMADGSELTFNATSEGEKINLVFTLGTEYTEDSLVQLFSNVGTVWFLMDGEEVDTSLTLRASDFFTGDYINENTTLTYDRTTKEVYLQGISKVVPEPTTATLSLLALAALAARRRRR